MLYHATWGGFAEQHSGEIGNSKREVGRNSKVEIQIFWGGLFILNFQQGRKSPWLVFPCLALQVTRQKCRHCVHVTARHMGLSVPHLEVLVPLDAQKAQVHCSCPNRINIMQENFNHDSLLLLVLYIFLLST